MRELMVLAKPDLHRPIAPALLGAYFTRFHANSAVPPTDGAGLVYFSSSAVSDAMIRF